MELIVIHRQVIKTIGFEHCSGGVLTICIFFLIQMHKQYVTEMICSIYQMVEIDFTEDKENFQWKGHGPLLPKEGSITVPAGFKLQTGLQLIPAAPVSALVVEARWGLLAAGTVHGFIVYDYLSKKTVTTKWTVSQGKSGVLKST